MTRWAGLPLGQGRSLRNLLGFVGGHSAGQKQCCRATAGSHALERGRLRCTGLGWAPGWWGTAAGACRRHHGDILRGWHVWANLHARALTLTLDPLSTAPEFRLPNSHMRVFLLHRLRQPLPVAPRTAGAMVLWNALDLLGDHRAACPTAGVLGERARRSNGQRRASAAKLDRGAYEWPPALAGGTSRR